jgi:hypothetical protein
MANFSGKDATIKVGATELNNVEGWTLDITGNTPNFVTNSTSGWNSRVAGSKDATGSFNYVLASDETMPYAMHATMTLILHLDGSDTGYWTVPAIITSVPTAATLDGADKLMVPYEFGATGPAVPTGIYSASGV